LFRAITGAGIGGEYAAINSAIDELIPARVRGRVDLIINGSYWVGAAMGAAATLVLLDPRHLPIWLGWRLAFGIGAALGLIVIFFRRWIPESPRWLMIHGRNHQAEEIVTAVERKIAAERSNGVKQYGSNESVTASITPSLHYSNTPVRIRTRTHTPWCEIWNAIVH
jgi:MFS family permease